MFDDFSSDYDTTITNSKEKTKRVELTKIIDNINQPIIITFAILPNDKKESMFIGTILGEIIVIHDNKARIFLDIKSKLGKNNGALLGLSFHSNFTINGKFFITYSFLINDQINKSNKKNISEEYCYQNNQVLFNKIISNDLFSKTEIESNTIDIIGGCHYEGFINDLDGYYVMTNISKLGKPIGSLLVLDNQTKNKDIIEVYIKHKFSKKRNYFTCLGFNKFQNKLYLGIFSDTLNTIDSKEGSVYEILPCEYVRSSSSI